MALKIETGNPSAIAGRIAFIYVAIAVLWILGSDHAIDLMHLDSLILDFIIAGKRWFYVIFTGLLLFWLIRQQLASQNSTNRYNRALFEESGIGLILIKPSGQFIDVNPAFAALIGYSVAEILDTFIQEITPSKYHEKDLDIADSIQQGDRFEYYEKEYTHKDGHLVPVLITGFVIKLNDELLILSSVQNNSVAKTEKEALWHDAENFHRMTTNSPIGIFFSDINGNIVYNNKKCAELTGLPAYEALNNDWVNGIHPDDKTLVLKNWAKSITRGDEFHMEYRWLHADGKIVWTLSDVVPFNADGDADASIFVGTFSDITKRKEMEADIRRNETSQREILNSMAEAVLTIDGKGLISTFNRAAEILFGYKAEDIIGRRFQILVLSSNQERFDLYIRSRIAHNQNDIADLKLELTLQRKDQSTFPAKLMAKELSISANGNRRFIASISDLTDSKQQEEQMFHSQKMESIGNLTGGIAHDYNNILAVILGAADLLNEKFSMDKSNSTIEKYIKYLDKIIHASERGAALTKKLLLFSGRHEGDSQSTDINHLLSEEQLMLEKTLTARISINYSLCKDIWPICIDPGDLEDAILNMSINSMHAIDGNGSITFKTNNTVIDKKVADTLHLVAGEYVSLSVIDTGCGMDEPTKEKAFEPFFSNKGAKGTGLGLSQVYGMVERNKGAIIIKSELGKGTELTLYFPRFDWQLGPDSTQIPSEPQPSRRQEQHPLTLGHEIILVVDDEPSLLELTTDVLNQHGYKTIAAKNGSEALAYLAKKPVDLVLSDIIMPDMDGYQLAATIKDLYPSLPIQLVSGYADKTHEDIVDDELIENLLQKPLHAHVLLSRVRDLMDSNSSP